MADDKQKKITFSLRLSKKFFLTLFALTGVVLVWRGLWHLVDLYIFPNNQTLSALFSLVIGLIILYLPDEDIKELL